MLITLLCLQTGDRVNRHLFIGTQQGTSLQWTKHKSLFSNTDLCRTDPPKDTPELLFPTLPCLHPESWVIKSFPLTVSLCVPAAQWKQCSTTLEPASTHCEKDWVYVCVCPKWRERLSPQPRKQQLFSAAWYNAASVWLRHQNQRVKGRVHVSVCVCVRVSLCVCV